MSAKVLHLSPQHRQQLQTHAEQTYPRECCGLMLGQLSGDTYQLLELWQAENAWEDDAANLLREADETGATYTSERRYTIAPELMLQAQKTARDRQWQILGIYHSHPNATASPSECDRQWAWPEYLYVILAVRQGVAEEVRCWQLDETHQFQAVPLSVSDEW